MEAPRLTADQARAVLDALDTLDSTGTTPVVSDLEVLAAARAKLEQIAVAEQPWEQES